MKEIKDLGSAIGVNGTYFQKSSCRIYITGNRLSIWHNENPIIAEEDYKNCSFDDLVPTDLDDLISKVESLIQTS